jgi:hypothetical protein
MGSTHSTKRIAFLDTNALLALHLYWEICSSAGLRLDACTERDDLIEQLRSAIAMEPVQDNKCTENLLQGMHLFQGIQQRVDDWDMYTSEICMFEMHHTLLEHRAACKSEMLRVPRRLRSVRPLVVLNRVLASGDYSQLDADVLDFFDALELQYAIVIRHNEKEGGSDLSTVLEIARKVWAHVLMDVMDAYIYSSAISCWASILITKDSIFRDAVNRIYRPPDSEAKAIRDSLKEEIAKQTTWKKHEFRLPEARSLQNPFPPLKTAPSPP